MAFGATNRVVNKSLLRRIFLNFVNKFQSKYILLKMIRVLDKSETLIYTEGEA